MARKDESAAVSAAAAMLAASDEAEEAGDEAAGQESEEDDQQGATESNEPEVINFEVELPEDLLAELEEEEPTIESVANELEQDEEYQLLDDDSKRLLARAKAAEKKAEWLENQRIKSESKKWQEEAKKFFPLATPFLEDIDATSRKGFLRKAKEQHEKLLPLWKETVSKQRESLDAERARIREEEKEAAKKQWGNAPGSTAAPTDSVTQQDQIKRSREKKDLAGTIRAMMFGGEDG